MANRLPVAEHDPQMTELDHSIGAPPPSDSFLIRSEKDMPPALRDYVPSKAMQLQRSMRPQNVQSRIDDEPVVVEAVEYRTADKTLEANKHRQAQIDEATQQIINTYKQQSEMYERAKRFIASATDAERANPSKKLQRAMQIVAKGAPITKEEATRRARKQILRNVI